MRRAKPIKQVTDALKGRSRTSLYDWIWDHWEELPEYRRYRVNWQKLTAGLTELGLSGRDETKPLSVDLVRMTFLRVLRDKEAEAPAVPVRQPTGLPLPPVRSSAAHQLAQAQKTTEGGSDASRRTTSAGFDHDPDANEDAIRRRFLGDKAD